MLDGNSENETDSLYEPIEHHQYAGRIIHSVRVDSSGTLSVVRCVLLHRSNHFITGPAERRIVKSECLNCYKV